MAGEQCGSCFWLLTLTVNSNVETFIRSRMSDGHQTKDQDAEKSVKSIYYQTDFHQSVLQLQLSIGKNSEYSAENHKGGVGCNHNFGPEKSVKSIYYQTDFHQSVLQLQLSIGKNSEYSAENHKGGVGCNHNFGRRHFQSPGELPEGQNRPGNQHHQGAECCKKLLFHKSTIPFLRVCLKIGCVLFSFRPSEQSAGNEQADNCNGSGRRHQRKQPE